MPRMAALIPADASENKEMPQRAGIAVIAPFPLASAADSNPPELAQRTKAGWGGEISFALGIPTVAGVQLRGDALNLLARSFFSAWNSRRVPGSLNRSRRFALVRRTWIRAGLRKIDLSPNHCCRPRRRVAFAANRDSRSVGLSRVVLFCLEAVQGKPSSFHHRDRCNLGRPARRL